MTYTLNTPRFSAIPSGFSLGPGASGVLPVLFDAAGNLASPSQTGLLMLHTHAPKGREADLITITP
jgi:hypothetical protein